VSDCSACDSIAAGSAPGGCIHETAGWYVDHCVGPLGVGTLIVKPKRHVVHVADLTADHAGGVPGHIHFVGQPVTRRQMDELGLHGPRLQVEMFALNEAPAPDAAAAFAERARAIWPG
jgi:hypothetical protein